MNYAEETSINPELDLKLERVIDVPPELVWEAWTNPEHLKHWFCPAPWSIARCEIDLRPGGIFSFTMRSPDGEEHPNIGCYLEVKEKQKLVWTDALQPGFRPTAVTVSSSSLMFTAKVLIQAEGKGTRYAAIAMHRSDVDRKQHEDMGFHDGWGTCLDQMVAYIKKLQQ